MQERRIGAKACKADDGPASEQQRSPHGDAESSGAPPARREEPDHERPEEQLENRGDRNDDSSDRRLVAVAPGDGRSEDEERGQRTERERVDRGGRDERDAVATPIFDVQEAERSNDGDKPAGEDEPATYSGRQLGDGREEKRARGRVDELVEVRERRGGRRDVGGASVDDRERGSAEDAEVLQRIPGSQLVPEGEAETNGRHPQERCDFPWLSERAEAITEGVEPITHAAAKAEPIPQFGLEYSSVSVGSEYSSAYDMQRPNWHSKGEDHRRHGNGQALPGPDVPRRADSSRPRRRPGDGGVRAHSRSRRGRRSRDSVDARRHGFADLQLDQRRHLSRPESICARSSEPSEGLLARLSADRDQRGPPRAI